MIRARELTASGGGENSNSSPVEKNCSCYSDAPPVN